MPHTDEVITDDAYWDCECRTRYIHRKDVSDHCNICGACAEDQPDSRPEEIAIEENLH